MKENLLKITIAIDGFSSTGKSTVAKQLATALGYIYVDSGAMYRAITLFAIQNQWIRLNFFDKDSLIQNLTKAHLQFKFNEKLGFAEMYLNGVNVETDIRSMLVSGFVSEVATIEEIRSYLVELQRDMGKNKGVVMDGRDIGSVVFPDAELKLFLTADARVRAERRVLELNQKGDFTDFETIYHNVIERDRIDSTRVVSPLTRVKDAIEIDVTHIDKEQQFQKIYDLAINRIENKISR